MKIFSLLFLLSIYSFALDSKSTLALYEHLFTGLSMQKLPIVYVDDRKYQNIFSLSHKLQMTEDITSANIILITHKRTLRQIEQQVNALDSFLKHRILFATEYKLLKESKEIVGASYWKKGRAQLLFIEKRLKKLNITLPKEYEKFMVDML